MIFADLTGKVMFERGGPSPMTPAYPLTLTTCGNPHSSRHTFTGFQLIQQSRSCTNPWANTFATSEKKRNDAFFVYRGVPVNKQIFKLNASIILTNLHYLPVQGFAFYWVDQFGTCRLRVTTFAPQINRCHKWQRPFVSGRFLRRWRTRSDDFAWEYRCFGRFSLLFIGKRELPPKQLISICPVVRYPSQFLLLLPLGIWC